MSDYQEALKQMKAWKIRQAKIEKEKEKRAVEGMKALDRLLASSKELEAFLKAEKGKGE